MTAPAWIEGALRDFGRGAGLPDFTLDGRGVAAIRFENGFSLRFEYTGEELAVEVAVPAPDDPATAKRLLSYAQPAAQRGVQTRTARLAKSASAVFATLVPAQDVTLPALNSAFETLWGTAKEFGGAA